MGTVVARLRQQLHSTRAALMILFISQRAPQCSNLKERGDGAHGAVLAQSNLATFTSSHSSFAEQLSRLQSRRTRPSTSSVRARNAPSSAAVAGAATSAEPDTICCTYPSISISMQVCTQRLMCNCCQCGSAGSLAW